MGKSGANSRASRAFFDEIFYGKMNLRKKQKRTHEAMERTDLSVNRKNTSRTLSVNVNAFDRGEISDAGNRCRVINCRECHETRDLIGHGSERSKQLQA
jgi:hypothetical protein